MVCAQLAQLLVEGSLGCWSTHRCNVPSVNLNGKLRSVANAVLPFHPYPSKRAIVRYLDFVDRRIRRYVAAKRKLIALLEEEKQAVVNRAVTRGLDPNVRLKSSGVEWLDATCQSIGRFHACVKNLGDALI